jgi:hypothetical protein
VASVQVAQAGAGISEPRLFQSLFLGAPHAVTGEDGGTLPLELSALGAPGCLPWNEVAAVLGVHAVDAQGRSTRVLPIPAAGSLVGRTFTFQWWALSVFANRIGTVTSNGLRVTIGQ